MIGIPLFKGSRSMSFVARRNRRLLRCLYDSWFFREFFRTVESCFWIVSLWIVSGDAFAAMGLQMRLHGNR
ncbi:MAG: hypothetical protein EOR61_27285 [Mesorhizobium sp.]|nr:MAG: hypothetical protein EOQ84_26290 [Mesorhizobium sp.]RWL46937.1 MAG: hypothetical protein EOR61_27285 [Mesorhizobium sp.]TIP43885.1 MAG: hypothetical protein E5X69_15600 [Mesorhizobium sp.]